MNRTTPSSSPWSGCPARISAPVAGILAAVSVQLSAADPTATQWSRENSALLADPGKQRPAHVAGELLVRFRPGAAGRADDVRTGIGAQKLKEWPGLQSQHWRLPAGLDVERAQEILSRNPHVEFAEPNYMVSAADFPETPPNDTYRGELWGLHNVGQTGGTPGSDIGGWAAWSEQLGSESVVVAVIDSGIDYEHPDLASNIWINAGEIPGDGIDNDGNGYIDDVHGWNFVSNTNDPMDDNGHGTHVAGTIGAVGDNGEGVIGVSPIVRLMPLKFLSATGSGSTANAISAIQYAASFKNPAGSPVVRISNNSWGGGAKSKTLENAIKNSGALFCAAAGNSGSSTVHYPAAYNLANVISVAATDHNDALAGFSNFGSWVHLAAPGVRTFSTFPGAGYYSANGTSMATPHVAGALAVLRAEFPSWDNSALRSRLLGTVDSRPSLSGKVTTGGRLNVARALGAAPLPSDDATPPDDVTDLGIDFGPTETSVGLIWTATGDDGSAGSAYAYDLRYATAPITVSNWLQSVRVGGQPLPKAAGETEQATAEGLRAGNTYFFAVRVIDEAGNASALSNALEVIMPSTGWTAEVVDAAADRYSSLAYHPSGGQPVIAYVGQANVKLASRGAAGWTSETIAAGRGGVSLAYNSLGSPAVSWVGNTLKGRLSTTLFYGAKSGSSWAATSMDSDVQQDSTSLAMNPAGQPAVSYRVMSGSNAGLRFAWREGSVWKMQTVHAQATARYNALVFSGEGRPLIAYSHDVNGDNYLDTLMFAEGAWNGSGYNWSLSALETGVMGYGVFPSVSLDPAGNVVIAHGSSAGIRILQQVDGDWASDEAEAGFAPFMTVDSSGVIHLAFDDYQQGLRVATRPADAPGSWTSSIAVAGGWLQWPGSIRVNPEGTPGASFQSGGLRFMSKDPEP